MHRIRQRLGRRGSCMLWFAFLDLVYGYGFFVPTPQWKTTPAFIWLGSILPTWAWGMIWTLTGLVLLVYAFKENDAIAWGMAMALKVVWGVLFFLGAFFATPPVDRGVISAVVWFGLAGLLAIISTWREPDIRVVVKDD